MHSLSMVPILGLSRVMSYRSTYLSTSIAYKAIRAIQQSIPNIQTSLVRWGPMVTCRTGSRSLTDPPEVSTMQCVRVLPNGGYLLELLAPKDVSVSDLA